MKTKLISLIILGFLTISLTSCKKEDNLETKKELLSKKKWELYKWEEYNINDEFIESEPVEDVYFWFKTDYTLVIMDGDDQIYIEGKWDINKEENMLYFIDSQDNEAEVYIIIKLNKNELVIKENISYPSKNKISTYEILYFKR